MNYVIGGCLVVLSIEDIRKQMVPVWELIVLLLSSIVCGVVQHISPLETVFGVIPGVLMVVLAP